MVTIIALKSIVCITVAKVVTGVDETLNVR